MMPGLLHRVNLNGQINEHSSHITTRYNYINYNCTTQ